MKGWGLGAVVLWLVVVGAGSTAAWYAIERAGQQVTSTLPFDTTTAGPTSAAPRPSRTPTTAVSPQPSPTVSSSAAEQVETWTGPAGSMTVACAGSRGRLVGATPADGWRAQERGSSTEVQVVFERGEARTRVRATCPGSSPSFRVDSGRDDGTGGETDGGS